MPAIVHVETDREILAIDTGELRGLENARLRGAGHQRPTFCDTARLFDNLIRSGTKAAVMPMESGENSSTRSRDRFTMSENFCDSEIAISLRAHDTDIVSNLKGGEVGTGD